MINISAKHIYVHVPFCKKICNYCAFNRTILNIDNLDLWLSSIEKQFNSYKFLNNIETLYIGGGTPSCLPLDKLDRLLNLFKDLNPIEYTIEVNPDDTSIELINLFKKYNINRVSIGLQDTNNKMLKLLNRRHSFDDCKNLINLLNQNNIHNISIDLIYSLPNQTLLQLEDTLNQIVKLDVKHISIYSLQIEENSYFKKINLQQNDDELEADMYELIIDKLKENNFIQYEVSNFSKNDYKSKHNIAYWLYKDFLGLGMGAHSKIDNATFENATTLKKYFKNPMQIENKETLTKDDMMFEHIMMNLRLVDGIDINEFNLKYDIDFLDYYKDVIEKHKNNIYINNQKLSCNLALLNTILLDFMK